MKLREMTVGRQQSDQICVGQKLRFLCIDHRRACLWKCDVLSVWLPRSMLCSTFIYVGGYQGLSVYRLQGRVERKHVASNLSGVSFSVVCKVGFLGGRMQRSPSWRHSNRHEYASEILVARDVFWKSIGVSHLIWMQFCGLNKPWGQTEVMWQCLIWSVSSQYTK